MNTCSSIHNYSTKKENRQMTILFDLLVTGYCLLALSSQRLIQPIQKALLLRFDRGAQALRQLLEQLALLLGQLRRHRHIDDHQLVAAPTAPQIRDALVLDMEDSA